MITGILTAKKTNNADKNVQKNSEIFKPNLHKVTCTGTNIVAIWLSSCLSPVFCSQIIALTAAIFFSWEDSKLQVLKSFRKLENDTYRGGVLITIQCTLLVAAKKIVCHVPVAISFLLQENHNGRKRRFCYGKVVWLHVMTVKNKCKPHYKNPILKQTNF